MAAPAPPASPSPDSPSREAGTSEGMASVKPAKDRPLRDEENVLADLADTGLSLPHERDQSTDMTDAKADPQVEQASRDLGRGLQDTDKGKPMNEAYRKLKR
ncbi:hypothetical protein [Polaromonas sp.]|uniref:hypothetical protein n=1 Tax=Polaromonas sp. TaxID=1869339 RepID=UPI00326475E4